MFRCQTPIGYKLRGNNLFYIPLFVVQMFRINIVFTIMWLFSVSILYVLCSLKEIWHQCALYKWIYNFWNFPIAFIYYGLLTPTWLFFILHNICYGWLHLDRSNTETNGCSHWIEKSFKMSYVVRSAIKSNLQTIKWLVNNN